jgi:hypothetical protein
MQSVAGSVTPNLSFNRGSQPAGAGPVKSHRHPEIHSRLGLK